jgi:hypothetical protein
MRRLSLTLAIWLALAGAALAAGATYDFTANFNLIPAGTVFGTPQQQIVFPPGGPVSYRFNADTGTNHFYTIVGNCKGGENCIQIFLPKGDVGGNPGLAGYGSSGYIVSALATDVINVEFDILFQAGFDFHSQGKIGPRIDNNQDGLRVMWNASGVITSTSNARSHWRMYLGKALTGGHWLEAHTPWTLATNVWYHIHMQYAGDPTTGFSKIWIQRPIDPSPVLYFSFGPSPNTSASNNFSLNFSSFFGGAGRAVAARNDSRILQTNIHVYSGLAMQE